MPETKPRYTVELTTEGWQIKDNERGFILADVYGSERAAGTAIIGLRERARLND